MKQIERVIYVVFSPKDERVYRELAPIYFPPAPGPSTAQAEGKPKLQDEETVESGPKPVTDVTSSVAGGRDGVEAGLEGKALTQA